MAQIESLVRHHEILGEDKITAPHLEGKWMSVQEFVRGNGNSSSVAKSAPQAAVVPPRPDERTLTSLTAPSKQSTIRPVSSDAVHNLFEILQAARERKPQEKQQPQVIPEMPRPVERSSSSPLLWIALPAFAIGAVIFWKMMGSEPSEPVSSDSEARIVKHNAPNTVEPAPAAVAVAAKPKIPAVAPPGFTPGRTSNPAKPAVLVASLPNAQDRERDREMEREKEREREREAEREHEREKERENEMASNSRDTDRRESEREQERATASAADAANADTTNRGVAVGNGSAVGTPFGAQGQDGENAPRPAQAQ